MTKPIQIDYISVSTTKTVSLLEHDKTYPDRLYFSNHYKNVSGLEHDKTYPDRLYFSIQYKNRIITRT